jgi:hypothetical protein
VEEILVGSLGALVVSIFTSFITVRLSISQFRSQRWWEKQAEAYSSIVENLAAVKLSLGAWYSEALGESRISDEQSEELRRTHRDALIEVRKAAATGAYAVSPETAETLESLVRELENEGGHNYVEAIDRHYGAVAEALTHVRDQANNVLR